MGGISTDYEWHLDLIERILSYFQISFRCSMHTERTIFFSKQHFFLRSLFSNAKRFYEWQNFTISDKSITSEFESVSLSTWLTVSRFK